MSRSKKIIAAAAVAAISQFAVSNSSFAADIRWDGGGVDNNLNTAANWVGDVNPGTADFARFDAVGASKLTPSTNGGAVQWLSIFFGNTATLAETTAYTIGGTNAITVGSTAAGNYLNNDSEIAQTINAPVNMVGGTVNATNAALVFGGVFNIGNNGTVAGNSVTVAQNNNVTFAGGVTGNSATNTSAALTKVGTGTLTVNGATGGWTGNVFINGGAVRINNANAFGTANRIETALTSGGTGLGALELDGSAGNIVLAKSVTTRARQAPTINEISLRNIAGTNTISNVLTGSGGSQFNYESAGGTLIIGNWNASATTGARQLRLLGASNGEITAQTYSATATTAALIKEGAGTWTLRNSITGTGSYSTATVSGGTLVLDAGLGAKVTGSSTINNTGTLQVVSSDGITGEVGNGVTATILNVKAGGALNASTFTDYSLQVGQTLIGGGSISTGGKLSAFGDNRIYIGDVSTASAGTMSVTGNLSVSNAFAAAGGGFYFDLSNSLAGANDKINIAGDLLVDNNSGPINIRVSSLGGGFASGTYNLITDSGGTTPLQTDFALSVTGGGTTRQSLSLATSVSSVDLVVTGAPGNLVWKGNLSSDWDIVGTSNWFNTGTAAADKYFEFDNVTFDDTATAKNVNITTLVSPSSINVTTASNYTFSGGGTLSGAATLNKNGTGTLTIANTGPNTLSGPVNINAGTLQLGIGGTEGSLGTGAVANNGTLVINKSDSVTLGAMSGTGALVKQGTGDIVLNANSTYTGPTNIENGRALPNIAGAFGDASSGTVVSSTGQVYFVAPATTYSEAFSISGDGFGSLGVLRAGGSAVQTLNGPVTMTASSQLNVDGGANMVLANSVTGTGTLTKTGSGTLTLAGTGNNWDGGTVISGGVLAFSTDSQLSTGPVSIGAATLELAAGNNTSTSRNFTLTGAASTSGFSAAAGSTLTLNGSLVAADGFRKLGAGTVVIGTDNPTVAGTVVIGTAGANQANAGALRLTTNNGLGAAAISMPGTNVSFGTIELTNNITVSNNITTASREVSTGGPAIPMLTNVSGNNTYNGTITVNATGGGIGFESQAGALTVAGPIVNSVSERALWVRGAGNGVVNTALNSGSGFRVAKDGAGTWTLTSAATNYAGTTTVNAGTLILGGSLRNAAAFTVSDGAKAAMTPRSGVPDLASSRKTLQVGTLNLNTTGTLDMADNDLVVDAGVFTTLQAAVLAGFGTSGPGITSSTSDGSQIHALFDNALVGATEWNGGTIAANAVVGKYTYFGDANIDGQVSGDDYGVIDANLNTTPPVGLGWLSGDMNLDGSVTGDDYGVIDANLGLGTSNPLSASALGGMPAGSLSAVPEPSSIVVLSISGAMLLGRRRRGRGVRS